MTHKAILLFGTRRILASICAACGSLCGRGGWRVFEKKGMVWELMTRRAATTVCSDSVEANGKSVMVGATRNTSTFGRSDIWALLKLDPDGTINTVLENSTVGFSGAIPSPDGRRLALFGVTDPSNGWLLENY